MAILKRVSLLLILSVIMIGALVAMRGETAVAQELRAAGSCGDTVSDDAQLFAGRSLDVLNQARAINQALQADTRVATVTTSKLVGQSLKSYADHIQRQCPTWAKQNTVLLLLTQGNEPFLRLGSAFSGRMTAADFQQITLGLRSQFASGNYAQGTVDLLKQVQNKLTPNYTWLWVTLGVVALLVVGGVLAFMMLRRRQAATVATSARQSAVQAKQAAVNEISPLQQKIDELTPRIEVLQALVPEGTAASLRGLFEAAKGHASNVQEGLGNLLGNPDTNPNTEGLPVERYGQMQRSYQQVRSVAQEPVQLLNTVETIVQRLEQNPHERIDFQQLLPYGSASYR